MEDDVTTRRQSTDGWKALDFGPPPSGHSEPDQPVLVEYLSRERVAVITLNRPHADNAITTEMAARLTKILESISVRPVRVAIITGGGDRAFSVGSDPVVRLAMNDWSLYELVGAPSHRPIDVGLSTNDGTLYALDFGQFEMASGGWLVGKPGTGGPWRIR